MRALDRKLFRDVGRMRLQAIAIALIVASGVALFIAMLTAYRSVRASEHHFYTDQRFAHVWSSLARAPRSAARELAAIPGVAAVDARVVAPAILDVPGLEEPGSALVIGIPPVPEHAVDDLYLRRGRHVEPGQAGEIATGAAMAGALGALRHVAAMPPIVAMSPEVPAFRRSLFDRLGLSRMLSPASRMIIRNLTRRPLRSVLAAAGMAFAVAIVVLGTALSDGTERTIDVAFQRERREDISIQFAHPRALGTERDFLALPGILRVEPLRIVPARVLGTSHGQDVMVVGMPAGGRLRHVVDSAYREHPPTAEGITLTRWLAEQMELHLGELATIEIRENQRRVVTARVIEIVDEPLFNAIYIELGALGRILGEPETYSGVTLTMDTARQRELYAALKRLPVAASVDFRRAAVANFRQTSDRVVSFTRQIEVVFAIIIAFGVVYNTARIALAERSRELATLRVLGFTRREVSAILLGEVAVLAAPAIPLGSLAGYFLSGLVMRSMSGERMHVPLVVEPASYAFAIVVFVVAATLSALFVRRGLDRLDLLATLKARE